MLSEKPTILIADPEPRTVGSIFEPDVWARLNDLGTVATHADGSRLTDDALDAALASASIVVGQIDLPSERLRRMPKLRGIVNVEANFFPNVDYAHCFQSGVHVLIASPVFAEPVAEPALAMAIDLARGITRNHEGFRTGTEAWGPASNDASFSLFGCDVGMVGLGDLGSALCGLLAPFRCKVKAYDPWLSPRRTRDLGCEPAELNDLLATSRIVFLFAGVTSENANFFDAPELTRMPRGAVLLVMSRASIVDFTALVEAVRSGHVMSGINVFPSEPTPPDDPLRHLDGVLLSSHRTGGMPSAFHEIGRRVVEDVGLLLRGLPPQACKRAERETVGKMRSRPLSKAL